MEPGETTPSSSQSGESPPTAGPEPQAAADAGWQFAEDGADATPAIPDVPSEGIAWSASEYVSHQKGAGWFSALILVVAILSGGVYLLTRDVVSTVVVAVIGASFGIFALRKPEVLDYSVDEKGIYIGPKFYAYHLFKSFSLLEEDALHSILLVPQRRFDLPISVYYAVADESKIVGVIGNHLPHEERAVPPIDRLMSKIHF